MTTVQRRSLTETCSPVDERAGHVVAGDEAGPAPHGQQRRVLVSHGSKARGQRSRKGQPVDRQRGRQLCLFLGPLEHLAEPEAGRGRQERLGVRVLERTREPLLGGSAPRCDLRT